MYSGTQRCCLLAVVSFVTSDASFAAAVQKVLLMKGHAHHYLHGKVVEEPSPACHPPDSSYQPSHQGAKYTSALSPHLSESGEFCIGLNWDMQGGGAYIKLTTPALFWTLFGTSMSLNMLAGSFLAMLPSRSPQ